MEKITTIMGGLPAAVGVATRLIQVLRERSRYERASRALKLLKLKYEVEALRKTHHLHLPPLEIDPEEINDIHAIALRWSDPRKMRSEFWLRYVRPARWKGRVILVCMIVLGFICLGGAIATLIALASEELGAGEQAILVFICGMDLVIGYFVWTSSLEVYRALLVEGATQSAKGSKVSS
jgi:hypothetical protein